MELLLKPREMLDFGRGQQALRIICRDGRCWLTQTGDSRDHILNPGDVFTVRAEGQLIVTATQSCRLALILPGSAAQPAATLNRRVRSNRLKTGWSAFRRLRHARQQG